MKTKEKILETKPLKKGSKIKYWLKVYGKWIVATVSTDKSVNELFYKTPTGEFIFEFEVEDKISFTTEYKPINFPKNEKTRVN